MAAGSGDQIAASAAWRSELELDDAHHRNIRLCRHQGAVNDESAQPAGAERRRQCVGRDAAV